MKNLFRQAVEKFGSIKAVKAAIGALKKRLGIGSRRHGYNGEKAFSEKYGVFFNTMGGKLEGLKALSTSCLNNTLCALHRLVNGSICQKCFSVNTQGMYKGLKDRLIKNGEVLKSTLIPVEEWPELNERFFRIESFGDVENEIQARNYIHFILKNPDTMFGWWTKNPVILDNALKMEGFKGGNKPNNCIFLVSSLMENHVAGIDNIKRVFPWVDKEFVVLSPEFVLLNPEYENRINCGARQCMACKCCYTHNSITTVFELEK